MKILNRFVCMCMLLVLLMGVQTAYAIDARLNPSMLSKQEALEIIKSMELIRYVQEPEKKAIHRFDVNWNGMYVVGNEGVGFRYVNVYAADGTFQYGYMFKTKKRFGVAFDGNDLMLFDFGYVVTLDPEGKVKHVQKLDISDANHMLLEQLFYARSVQVGGDIYTLRNNMGALNWLSTSYTQLVRTSGWGNGEVTILYASNETVHLVETIAIGIGLTAFICIWLNMFLNSRKAPWKMTRGTKRLMKKRRREQKREMRAARKSGNTFRDKSQEFASIYACMRACFRV